MFKQQLFMFSAAASLVVASGCSSMAADNKASAATSGSSSMVELQAAQSRISQLESELAARNQTLADTQVRLASTGGSNAMPNSDTSLFPPNSKAGECYARVLIPAKYRTVSESVQTTDAAERFEITPARYEMAQERVLVKEASTKLEVVPAVYGEVQEQVLVKPASTKITEVPVRYDTKTERVIDEPAHTAWKKGPAALQSSNVLSQSTSDTGEVMCLVEVPATFKTVQKKVLVSPARTDVVKIPAEYKTVTKRVVKQPATTREITIPAQYDTIQVTKLVAPAAEKRIAIPATYSDMTRNELVTAESMEWRQVMCEVNMTKSNVMALQKALADKGYYKAGIDGIIGHQTISAAQAYAMANNLPAGSNYIPMQVIKKLNLDI